MKYAIGHINKEGTERLQSLGYPTLVIYREPHGWKVRDESLARQYWNALGRNCDEVIRKVRQGILPYALPELPKKDEND